MSADRFAPNGVNSAMCKALGIDGENVTAVNIRLRPGHFPTITIQRLLPYATAEEVKATVERFQLVPKNTNKQTENP